MKVTLCRVDGAQLEEQQMEPQTKVTLPLTPETLEAAMARGRLERSLYVTAWVKAAWRGLTTATVREGGSRAEYRAG